MAIKNVSVRMRIKQEQVGQIIKDGYYKTFIKLQSTIFKEYVRRGFTREEALEILLVMIQNDSWNLEPTFIKEQLNDEEQGQGVQEF
jgi:hypothetical protein